MGDHEFVKRVSRARGNLAVLPGVERGDRIVHSRVVVEQVGGLLIEWNRTIDQQSVALADLCCGRVGIGRLRAVFGERARRRIARTAAGGDRCGRGGEWDVAESCPSLATTVMRISFIV